MIRSLLTLLFGVFLAVAIIVTAFVAAVWVIGLAGKAALFGEPRATLAMKLWQRVTREAKKQHSDITHITPTN